MKQDNRFYFEKDFRSYDDIERLVRQARARRDDALGRAVRTLCLAIAAGCRRLNRAVDEAYRLRALAMLDDRRLAAIGLDRHDLPAYVYGWETAAMTPVTPLLLTDETRTSPASPDRIAA